MIYCVDPAYLFKVAHALANRTADIELESNSKTNKRETLKVGRSSILVLLSLGGRDVYALI